MANTIENKINLAVTLSISSVIVLVNKISILITLYKDEIRRKRRNKLFLNLILSHFMLGLLFIIQTIMLWFSIKHIRHSIICINGAATTTLCATVALTIDRFICIKYPYRYLNLPKWFTNVIMSLCWIIAIIYVIANINFINYNLATIPIHVFNVIAIITLPACNSVIFKESRKHIKNISASMVFGTNTDISNGHAIETSSSKKISTTKDEDESLEELKKTSPEVLKKLITLKEEIRAAYFCILLMTSYFVCWLPITVHTFITSEKDSYIRAYMYI